MTGVRMLFFVLAALAMLLVVGFELGTMWFIRSGDDANSVPGLGGPYLAMLDGILLYLVILIAIGHLPFKGLTARISSVVTLVLSLLGAIGAFAAIFTAFQLIMLMLALFMAAPWGTLAYLAAFADFPKGEALAALTVVMMLKLVFLVMLALADLGYLKMKGLLFLIGLSLLATWLTSFLIAFPPGFLASITDAVGGLITAVLAFIMLIIIFVTSIIQVINSLTGPVSAREV
jgi:hypothetical protein